MNNFEFMLEDRIAKLQAYWQGKVKMTPAEYWDTYYYVYGFIYQMQEKRRMGKIR